MIKYFRFDLDYVLWSMSFTNLSMLLATTPKLIPGNKKEGPEGGPELVTDNPDALRQALGM